MARIHRGSGVREHDLVSRARTLAGTTAPLLPRLTQECPPDRFDRRRDELEEVRAAREDAHRLEKLSRRGDPMARAYAGLLRFALEPSTPNVVSFPLPGGEVSFAPLARTDREAEVAVQQYDDPARLLLGYIDWARKGLHFFAGKRTLWCTGPSARPPEEFRTEKIASLPYRLIEDAAHHRYECPHLKDGEQRPYLEVQWRGAGLAFRVCRKCAKDDRHLLSSLSDGTASPDPSEEFPLGVALNTRCDAGAECVHASLPGLARGTARAYELGRLSDAAMIDAHLAEIRPRIDRSGRPVLVARGVCYGADLPRFLTALGPTPAERRALEAVLDGWSGPFEVDEPSASRALERLWPEHAEEIVATIVADPAEARRMVEDARSAPGRIAEILKRAQRQSEEREVLEALPHYSRLVREAAWVDRVAREYRTRHGGGAERAILQSLPREGKERGLAYGFLLALGRANAHAWQFSPTEKEFGASLAEPAHLLLAAPEGQYHAALDRLLTLAGVVDWGTREP